MDYTHLLNELNKATLFDLYRLYAAMGRELNNPHRITAIKQTLRVGMELSYFHSAENRSVRSKILELRQKNVVVLDIEQQKKFIVPYYILNVDGIETSIHENPDTLTANNLKVGDCVGFNNKGQDMMGIIKRLNPKTVTLMTDSSGQWLVGYSYLFRVHEGEMSTEKLSKRIPLGDEDE